MGLLDGMLLLLIGVCLYTDLREQRIYNKVLFPVLLAGLGVNIIFYGLSGLQQSALGFLLGLAVLLVPYLAGGMGAGDVKLMAVIGVIKGPIFVFEAFLLTAVAGGLIALFLLIRQGRLRQTLHTMGVGLKAVFLRIPQGPVEEKTTDRKGVVFPYGVAISIGSAMAYLNLLG